ncbi:MAG: hypothetical protein HEP71_14605 [Roseivirga sp.]|nr:hypothetical protein [Roseivirga sp.]
MKRGLFKNFLVLLVIIGLVSACNLSYFEDAEFGDFVWDASLAVPIGEITYSIDELFDELNDAGAQVGVNNENIVTLSYTEALQSQTASAFMTVLDQNFTGNVVAGVNINNPGVGTTVQVDQSFEFTLSQRNSEEYDSILFTSGNFDIEFSSDFDATIDFTLNVNSLINKTTGDPLSITGTLSPSGPTFTSNNNLGDFKGDFTKDGSGNTATNKVVVDFTYDITVEPTSVVNSTDKVDFTMTLTNAEFETVFGDVGTQGLDVNFQVVNLDFFRDFDAGGITFTDPVFKFVFENGFGFPLGIDFKNITAIGNEGQIVPLSGTATAEPTVLSAPTIDNIGTIETTNFELNSANSNIADLLSSQPRKVIMEVNASTNPANGPDQYNFVDTSSLLDVSVQVDLPLIANINNLVAEESMDFNNGTDLEEAKKLLLRVITENELPLGGNIELQFQDAANNVVFTVTERPVFAAAPIASGDRTTDVATTSVDVEFSNEDIRAIENATKIRVLVRLATTDAASGNSVKFFNDYELKIKLAAQADVEIGAN